MLNVNDTHKNVSITAKMIDKSYKIQLQESEELIDKTKPQNPQLYIKFNDLCYSATCHDGKSKFIFISVTLILRYQYHGTCLYNSSSLSVSVKR